MMLESAKHAGSSFVTLTYRQDKLPKGLSLDPRDPQLWLKRLRKSISPNKIRYFLVGEYGEFTARPHYHAAIFGLDPYVGGGSDGRSGIVRDSWGLGHTYTGDLTEESAGYVAGYVTKKMTSWEDKRLNGRYPEFARMSLRPGLGADAMSDVSRTLQTEFGRSTVQETGDVPVSLLQGPRPLFLGRYLRSVLRKAFGGLDEKIPVQETPEMLLMRLTFEQKQAALPVQMRYRGRQKWDAFGRYLVEEFAQKSLNMVSRFKAHTARGSL